MRKSVLFVFMTLVLCYCYGQHIEVKTFNSFPVSEKLSHSKVTIHEPLTPTSIYLLDSIVVLIDSNLDHALHFYNISDWSLIAKYGKRGDGPGEVIKPKFHGQFVQERGETYLWLSDYRTFKLKKLSLNKMMSNENAEPEVSLKMRPQIAWIYADIYAVSDNEFIGPVTGDIIGVTEDKEAGRFYRYNVKDQSISWMPNFPKQKLSVPQEKIGYLYSSASTFNSKTKKIASAMKFYDRVDIVDVIKGEVLTIVQKDKVGLKEVDLKDERSLIPPETMSYYTRAYSTERYIYLIYSNITYQEGNEVFQGIGQNVPKEQLHVFDWKGIPVFKGELDKWALGSFFVDEKTWTLYAINNEQEDEEDMIILYSLPKLDNKY